MKRIIVLWIAAAMLLVGCTGAAAPDIAPTAPEEGHSAVEEAPSASNSASADDMTGTESQEPQESQETVHASLITGSNFENRDYPDVQAFFDANGIEGLAPFYTYYDTRGNLQLELYYDEETEYGYGIKYEHYVNYFGEEGVTIWGFSFRGTEKEPWQAPDTYSTKTPTGTDGSELDEIEQYEEITRYNEDGRLEYFLSQGKDSDPKRNGEDPVRLIEIEFIYREDGTLSQKNYGHSTMYFSTTNCSRKSFYDSKERIVHGRYYLTHGADEYYYIYLNDEDTAPAYTLLIDFNISYLCWPEFFSHR